MDDKNQFEKLSKNLKDSERKELLDKIQKTKKDPAEGTKKSQGGKRHGSQYSYARKVYKESDFLSKIIIWFISLFTGQKREDVVLSKMFDEIKKDIQLHYAKIIDFKRDAFTQHFFDVLSSFVQACEKCIPIIDRYFTNAPYYAGFISQIIEANFDEKMTDNLRKIDPANLSIENDFIEKEDFHQIKHKAEKAFFNQVNLSAFSELNNTFIKFETLCRLINYNFSSILYNFSNMEKNYSDFAGVKFSSIESSLEKLYSMIEKIDFDFSHIAFAQDMIEYSKINPVDERELDLYFTEADLGKLKKAINEVNDFKSKVPLQKIFQYYKKNLNYRPMNVNIKFDCIALYKQHKKKEADNAWEVHYDKIKNANQQKLIYNLFNDNFIYVLTHFNNELKTKLDKKSNAKLKNVMRLNFLTKFIDKVYKDKVETIINKILIDGTFAKDSYRNNISSAYYLLFNSLERIKTFDRQINPDKDIGKKITTFLKISSNEMDFAQTLQNTIIDINDMSTELIDEIYNSLLTINNLTINLVTNSDNMKNLYITNIDRIKIPGFLTPFQALNKVIKFFDLFLRIYQNIEDF